MLRSLPRLPVLRQPRSLDRAEDPVSPAPASDKGFVNPMFNMVSRHCPETRGCLGTWAGGGRAPARTFLSGGGGATHLAGLLLSPGQEGVVGRFHPPAGHQLLGCCRNSALGGFCQGFCFPSPSVAFPSLTAAGATERCPWRGAAAGDGYQRPPGLLPQPSVRCKRDGDLMVWLHAGGSHHLPANTDASPALTAPHVTPGGL